MKKISTLVLSGLLTSIYAVATTHTINQSGTSFAPLAINVQVGDTVLWQWSSGTHTTTSVTVPAGAAGWDVPLVQQNPTFTYKVEVAGTYGYVCTVHSNMGGGFIASASSNVANSTPDLNWSASMANNNTLLLQMETNLTGNMTCTLIDITGKVIATMYNGEIPTGEMKLNYDASALGRGIYFIHLSLGYRQETRKVIKG
ncbi:MAG: T9SS type A sorting domain-containing protein [Flavobacteriales bacterium]